MRTKLREVLVALAGAALAAAALYIETSGFNEFHGIVGTGAPRDGRDLTEQKKG